MYKRNKSRNKKIKKSRNKKRVNKSRVRRNKSKVGGCDECNKSGSSPSTAKIWTSGGSINEDIFKHEVDPIFFSSSI
jgi:hypothetical protein